MDYIFDKDIIQQIDAETRRKLQDIVELDAENLFTDDDYPLHFLASIRSGFNVRYDLWSKFQEYLYGDTKNHESPQMNNWIKDDFYDAKNIVRKNYETRDLDLTFMEQINKAVLAHYEPRLIKGGYNGLRNIDVSVSRYDGSEFYPIRYYEVRSAINQALDDYKNTISENDPVVKLVAVFKFYIDAGLIHLYNEGNGRTDRLLLELMLLQNGYKLPLFYDFENFFVDNEEVIEKLIDNASKKYDDDDKSYVFSVIDFFSDMILEKYKELVDNYALAKKHNVDRKNKDDVISYFIAINQEFAAGALKAYLTANGLDGTKLSDDLTKLIKKGYLRPINVLGEEYYSVAENISYEKVHKTLKKKKFFFHL